MQRAFVSSTFLDLEKHRAHVIRSLRRAGFHVDAMEDWTAADQEPRALSRRRVEGCDLCVVLVAFRRGHVPQGDALSITQQEVRHAREQGIDVLPFLLDEKAAWPRDWDELDDDPGIRAWRAELKEHRVCGFFQHDAETLQIAPALTRWLSETHEARAERQYRQNLRDCFGRVAFVSVPTLKDVSDLPLESLYVQPGLSASALTPDSPPPGGQVSALLEELDLHRNLVVLGDPGAGKSTLVQWLACQLAQSSTQLPEGLRRRLPLPLILRDLHIDERTTWDRLLRELRAQLFATPLQRMDLEPLLREGRVQLLLDGVDEIASPAARRALRESVREAMQTYPRCGWLFTSRIVGYDAVPVHGAPEERDPLLAMPVRVTLRYLAPFDDARIDRFLQSWCSLRGSQAILPDLCSAVRKNDAIHVLARIPYLLTLMALIYRVRLHLPDGRALLYNAIVQAYLETIPAYRRMVEQDDSLAEQKRWLGRVGFEMQRLRAAEGARREPRALVVSRASVLGWLEAAMSEFDACEPGDAARLLDYLERRSGLLVPRSEDSYAFVHLSFQEYFAAVHLRDRLTGPGDEPVPLHEYAASVIWQETLVFLVELVADEQRRWLTHTFRQLFGPDFDRIGSSVERWRPLLLARLLANPHAKLTGELQRQARNCCIRWEAARMQGGGGYGGSEVLQTLLAAAPCGEPPVLDALVRELGDHAQRLDLSGTVAIDLSPLERIELQELNLSWARDVDLAPLQKVRGLRRLELNSTSLDLSPLGRCSSLTRVALNMARCDLSPLGECTGLRHLSLEGMHSIDLSLLGSLRELRALFLRDARIDPSELDRFTALTTLALSGPLDLYQVPLENLEQLRDLSLFDMRDGDLSSIARAAGLCQLFLGYVSALDLSPLVELPRLEHLRIHGSENLDLLPLTGVPSLRSLTLLQVRGTSIAPLIGRCHLDRADFDESVEPASIDAFQAAHPQCVVRR